ncbi:MAG: flagellar hook-basal body complex protein [Planctomycetota bacterium]
MIPSLYTAVSALKADQQYMSVVANNLANVNTVGFKGSRALFADTLSQTMRAPAASTATSGGGNGIQIGLGTVIQSVTPTFTQGSLQATGVNTDLAIEGGGFFVVQNVGTKTNTFTRNGAFTVDNLGNLITQTGEQVLGSAWTGGPPPNTAPVLGAALTPINIPTSEIIGGVPVPVTGFNIDAQGNVVLSMQDGSTWNLAAVGLENFSNPEGLLKVGDNMYQSTAAAGILFGTAAAPTFAPIGTNGLGNERSGYLEMSNVDLSQEFSNMIVAQRGLEANARTITSSDEILQDLISLKR